MTDVERVTLITSRLEMRGSSLSAFHLAQGLRERDVEVQVICRGGSLVPLFESEGIRTKVLEIYGDSVLNLFTWPGLVKTIRTFGPQLLHFQHPNLPRLSRILASRLQLPYAFTAHSNPLTRISTSSPWLMGGVAVSEGIQEEIVNESHISRELVAVIEDGVMVSPECAEPTEKPTKDLIIGAMNRLDEDRGLRHLVLAVRKLADRGFSAHVVIVGEGPEENVLRRMVRDQGLTEQVTIAHPSGDYRRILEVFDIFVSTSLSEGLGIFCLEAMALGTPVIATGVGGVFEYLRDGVTGFLVPPKDSMALADRIQRLADRADLRRTLGLQGREVVQKNYNRDRTIDATLEFYRQVLARSEEMRALSG